MKHHHDHDVGVSVDVDVDLPTQELEDLVDKVTNSALKIITAMAVAHILKSHLSR